MTLNETTKYNWPWNNEADLQNQLMSNLADKDTISSIDSEILKLNSSVALDIVHNLTLTDNDIQEIKQSARKDLSNAKVQELDKILLKLKKGFHHSMFDLLDG